MGKRKERRIAAMASSRRYKLDLFADPSGDLSEQEGVRDNLNRDGEKGVPDSPTTGKKENPLSLLSQYTDEDSDEEQMEISSDGTREGSVPNGQMDESTAESGKAGKALQEIAPATFEEHKDSNDQIESFPNEVEASGIEPLAPENQIIQSSSHDPVTQTISYASGDWKAVMDAETNQCYYWNTVTGETSWEVPAGLVLNAPNEVVSRDNATSIEASKEDSEAVQPSSLPLKCQMSGLEESGLPDKSHVVSTEEDKGMNGGTAFAEDFDPEKLVKYGEDLLERLNLLDGSSIQKIKEEINIRISDCKELKPYGMSLFPFWLHTQSKLKCLEASVISAEISLSNSTFDSIKEEAEKEKYVTSPGLVNSNQVTENGGKEKEKEVEEKEMEEGQGKEEKEIEEVREEETILPIEDVDMEIEEDESVTNTVSNLNCELAVTPLEEGELPPPPLPLPDDWVPPPPPPEDEPVPPPPEDEVAPPPPTEESPVSYPVVAPIPPYPNYMAVPTYNYSVPAGYTQPHYYEAYYNTSAQVSAPVLGAVAQAVPATSGMVEPTVYNYTLPVGQRAAETSINPESGLSVLQTGSYVGIANESLVSSATQAVEPIHVAGDSSVARSSTATSSAATSSAVISSIASPSVTASSGAMPSAAVAASVAQPAVSKDQSKGVKSKKRSIAVGQTLRSSKKVASLVNKWMAAKEELHNDDEPESAFEALERKRQKAIEEWKMHQIASGEAQDNPNFAPLGGDWRERVKRKRASKEAKMEGAPETSAGSATAAATVTENKEQGQEQHDLGQISIGLPSGWQAYWDESSKQVYYGNALTSETTWVRPT